MTYVLFQGKYMFWGHEVTTGTRSAKKCFEQSTQDSSTQVDSLGQTYV